MISLEVTMTVSAGGPIFCFVVLLKLSVTVVKSRSAGLRDCESETQLNLNRPLRISAGPRHLSWPLAPFPARIPGLFRSVIVIKSLKRTCLISEIIVAMPHL